MDEDYLNEAIERTRAALNGRSATKDGAPKRASAPARPRADP